MSYDPLFDGVPIFGVCCHSVHLPKATQAQVDSFFGVSGTTNLFGGSRGRVFEITGVLIAPDLPTLGSYEVLLLSYADGIARIYTDTQQRSWPLVIFDGEYVPNAEGPRPAGTGWCLPYRAVLRGLV